MSLFEIFAKFVYTYDTNQIYLKDISAMYFLNVSGKIYLKSSVIFLKRYFLKAQYMHSTQNVQIQGRQHVVKSEGAMFQ